MNTLQLSRIEELKEDAERYQQARRGIEQDIIRIEGQLIACRNERAELDRSHDECCELEARGQKNDRAKIEAALSTEAARQKGHERILAQKRADLQQLRNASDPVEAELRELSDQQQLEEDLSRIEAALSEGKNELQQKAALEESFFRRIKALRSIAGHAMAAKAGKDAAYVLECNWNGIRR